MVVALKPLHDIAKLKELWCRLISLFLGLVRKGMDELFNQTRGIYVNDTRTQYQKKFTKQIAL